jgi:hypothetical protein
VVLLRCEPAFRSRLATLSSGALRFASTGRCE